MPNALETLIMADSPSLFYKFVDASGSPADSSGNGHALTVYGAPVYGLPGVANTEGLAVGVGDGVGSHTDRFSYAPAAGVALPVPFTIEGWIYYTSASSSNAGGYAAGSRGPTEYGTDIAFCGPAMATTQGVRGEMGNPVASSWYTTSLGGPSAAVVANTWIHIAHMVDAAGWTSTVNGVQVGTQAGMNNANAIMYDQNHHLGFGNYKDDTSDFSYRFNGRLAYWACYPTRLTVAKMLQRFQAGTPIPPTVNANVKLPNQAISPMVRGGMGLWVPSGAAAASGRPGSGQLLPRNTKV